MKLVFRILLFFTLGLFLAACQGAPGPAASPELESAPPSVPAPADGKTTVAGRVISEETKQPMVGVPVRLAEVYREGESGAFILDGAFSPGARTDDQGYFIISDVDVFEYVIVVGDVENLYMIIQNSQGTAKVWETFEGQILETGILEVTLSN
jgi:hypothetical protein